MGCKYSWTTCARALALLNWIITFSGLCVTFLSFPLREFYWEGGLDKWLLYPTYGFGLCVCIFTIYEGWFVYCIYKSTSNKPKYRDFAVPCRAWELRIVVSLIFYSGFVLCDVFATEGHGGLLEVYFLLLLFVRLLIWGVIHIFYITLANYVEDGNANLLQQEKNWFEIIELLTVEKDIQLSK